MPWPAPEQRRPPGRAEEFLAASQPRSISDCLRERRQWQSLVSPSSYSDPPLEQARGCTEQLASFCKRAWQ